MYLTFLKDQSQIFSLILATEHLLLNSTRFSNANSPKENESAPFLFSVELIRKGRVELVEMIKFSFSISLLD